MRHFWFTSVLHLLLCTDLQLAAATRINTKQRSSQASRQRVQAPAEAASSRAQHQNVHKSTSNEGIAKLKKTDLLEKEEMQIHEARDSGGQQQLRPPCFNRADGTLECPLPG